jgi:glycosyltransferase involved in cell wall biosynthesis
VGRRVVSGAGSGQGQLPEDACGDERPETFQPTLRSVGAEACTGEDVSRDAAITVGGRLAPRDESSSQRPGREPARRGIVTTRRPRIAIGAPVFNRADYLEEAIHSLLAQSYSDFALVVVDDCSTDATAKIVQRYAARDSRVHYERNSERVGLVENWRRAYWVAAEKFPGLEYFAFASDHDVWHPRWLESLVHELDTDPAAVVAFPLWVPIREDGSRVENWKPRRLWDTAGLIDPFERVRRVAPGKRVVNVIYGLFRADALERCGVYSLVLAPDRLLMTQLAVLGTFKQVPRELWMRRLWTVPRPPQRARLFSGRPPLYAYLPTGLVHAAALFRWAVLEGRARPEVGRARGLFIAGAYVTYAGLVPIRHGIKALRKVGKAFRRRRSALRGWLRRRRTWRRISRKWLRGKRTR